MDWLVGDVAPRDPARFETILRGTAGVGGVDDLWRRGGAPLRERRFGAEHQADG